MYHNNIVETKLYYFISDVLCIIIKYETFVHKTGKCKFV